MLHCHISTIQPQPRLELDAFYLECERIAAHDWDYYDEWYSFQFAWEQGMTPTQAVQDCKAWLEA